ncbi:MAG TPA: S8 family serine peptidase [Bacteroidia bacterium]|nr:S8 family serine peptidase [Bacteroidia bacterium]
MKNFALILVAIAAFMSFSARYATTTELDAIEKIEAEFRKYNGDTLKFWVQFTDKKNSPYSVKNPEKYLSQRAIERRKRLDIKITEEDLPVNPDYMHQVSTAGVEMLNASRWLNGVSVQTSNQEHIKQIMALPFVKEVKKVGVFNSIDNANMDYLMEFFMSLGSEDSTQISEGGTRSGFTKEYYGEGFHQLNMLRGMDMHNNGYTGEGIVIAILDGGFMNANKIEAFKHLYESNRILGTYDFVKRDSNVYDDNNHGMNVLSCMAAKTPGIMVGTAPGASYWLLRTEDANSEYPIEEHNWATGAEFADSAGADLINSSLGYTTFDDKSMNHKYSDLDGKTSPATKAATIAAKRGLIICNAAGNEGDGEWRYIGAPADAEGIITVGGVDPTGAVASFSSLGPASDGRLKPNVAAQATEAIVASVSGNFYPSQGTSFATPILCGMVACLLQANPDKSPAEIIKAIEMSGNQYHHPDSVLGYGIPDFIKANRFLGGDKAFDYDKDQIESAPDEAMGDSLMLTVYLVKAQKVEVTLKNGSGKEVKSGVYPGNTSFNNFYRIQLEGLDKLGAGQYQLEVYINGKKKYTYNVKKG